jgi:glycosyltransferase involved in cell wall biosynthesis
VNRAASKKSYTGAGPSFCREHDWKMNVGKTNGTPKLKVLWFIDVDYRYGMNHGGNLRFFNLSKELLARGHEVYYVVRRGEADDLSERERYLDDLKGQKIITGYFEIDYGYPSLPRKLGSLIGHPGVVNRLLGKYQKAAKDRINGIIEREGIDLCIFCDRKMLFILPEVRRSVNTIIDWVDSFVLYRVREAKVCLKTREFSRLWTSLRYLIDALLQERYYGKLSFANLAVSPVDKLCLDRVNRVPQRNRVLLNGVKTNGVGPSPDKISNRIIFSGNMDFPPNYEAAIWFIDNVLPLLLEQRGDIKFVVAGANPVEELSKRAGEHVEVTGYVDDMRQEIARSALYVAPLISGGGFKNKVAEAVTAGTYIVATSMAVEFLAARIREHLLIADAPREMAARVIDFLDNPRAYEERLKTVRKIVEEEFQWGGRAEDLISLARETSNSHKGSGPPA